MGTLTNSEDQDEIRIMEHFIRVCHVCSTKLIVRDQITFICLEIITCNPSIHTIDHPDFIVCSFMENSIGLKRLR